MKTLKELFGEAAEKLSEGLPVCDALDGLEYEVEKLVKRKPLIAIDGDITVVLLPKEGELIIDCSETGELQLRVYLNIYDGVEEPDGILTLGGKWDDYVHRSN